MADSQNAMARELVWRENSSFAAWGCKACGWIMTDSGPTPAGRPLNQVKEAFDKHECSKFPRRTDTGAKRTP
jgi:hypothetical protein